MQNRKTTIKVLLSVFGGVLLLFLWAFLFNEDDMRKHEKEIVVYIYDTDKDFYEDDIFPETDRIIGRRAEMEAILQTEGNAFILRLCYMKKGYEAAKSELAKNDREIIIFSFEDIFYREKDSILNNCCKLIFDRTKLRSAARWRNKQYILEIRARLIRVTESDKGAYSIILDAQPFEKYPDL